MTQLLMCRPTHFDVEYVINPWMKDNVEKVDAALAMEQWTRLYDALCEVATVHLIDPVKNLPDMVFTANAGVVDRSKAFLSRFSHKERSGEEEMFRNWFLKNGLVVVEQKRHFFEGQGDCLRDKAGWYWLGHGFRSESGYAEVMNIATENVIPLHLVDPRFYHLDTCFFPIDEFTVMYYPGAFSDESVDAIEKYFDNTIQVRENEALTFCCNSIIIGKDVFMPRCDSKEIVSELELLGLTVHEFDMSEFLKSGGACKCLVLNLE